MAEKRVGGIAYVKVDGAQYPLRGNFTVSPDAFTRTGVAGQDRVHGYTEMPQVPFISGDITLTPDVSIETLRAMVNVTVTAELANGKTYVLREAWTADAHELNTAEGQTGVKWEGVSCKEF